MASLRAIGGLVLAFMLPIGPVAAGKPSTVAAGAPALVTLADLAGERCSASVDQRAPHDPDVPAPLRLTCNDNSTAVGLLRPSLLPLGIPATGPARRAAIETAARRSLAAGEIAQQMNCRSGQWVSMPDGSEIEIALCMRREGGWPQLALTYAQGRTLYQGASLPVLFPVLIQAIAAESAKPMILPAAVRDPGGLGRFTGAPITSCTASDYAASDTALRQARTLNSRGNSAEAEAAYRTALDVQTRVFGAESPGVGEVLTSLALEVSNQQRFEEAASLFRRADPIVERSSSEVYRARLLAYRALDAANRNRYDEALQLARAATALRRRSIDKSANFSDDAGRVVAQDISRGELLHSLMIEAQMLLRLDDLASAEAAAAEALDIVVHTEGLPLWWRPNVLAFMGDLNAREGRLAVSERQHLDALRYRQRIFGESGPTTLSHLALGRIYGAEDARPAALAAYHAAFDILEKERATRSAITFNQIAPFLKVAADPSTPQTPDISAEIFRAIQLTGASVTDQTIERSANRLATADPAIAGLLRDLDDSRRQLAGLRIAYAEETDKPAQLRDARRETALATDIVAADRALTDAGKHLQSSYPAFSALSEPGTVSLEAFRAHLTPDEALIAFALGSKESWVVLVSKDRLVARPLAVTDDGVAAEVATLRQAFVPRQQGVARFDLKDAHGLYGELLGPVADQLGGFRHLVFVAHGALASLPLAVLVASASDNGAEASYQDADWLVKHFAVSEVPTIRSLVALREAERHHRAPALPFLGFAAPDFTGQASATRSTPNSPANDPLAAISGQCRAGGPVAPALLRALAPLPETATEATTVAGMLGAGPQSVHIGADASEAALRQQPLDQYGVIYFATHGLLPGELRCQSEPGLAMSPPPVASSSRADDGLLDSSEIASFRLNADLIVLSACNTAESTGRFGGDALSGLAEAFFYAGARGVIASHWQVPSRATVGLMTGMFDHVKAVGTAEALRQSQMRLIQQPETAHPFYWAAFTLIGDGLAASDSVAAR